jgi:hypothetical protein
MDHVAKGTANFAEIRYIGCILHLLRDDASHQGLWQVGEDHRPVDTLIFRKMARTESSVTEWYTLGHAREPF